MAALGNCILGEVYLAQHRHDQAYTCFTTALQQWPGRPSTHRNIAEVWLRRDNPGEALRWARLAVEKERADPGVTPETKAGNLAMDLGVLALATAAASGNRDGVDKAVHEAANLCGGVAVTVVAQAHVYCGMAYLMLNKMEESAGHFELAARVDPHGYWGREGLRLTSDMLRPR